MTVRAVDDRYGDPTATPVEELVELDRAGGAHVQALRPRFAAGSPDSATRQDRRASHQDTASADTGTGADSAATPGVGSPSRSRKVVSSGRLR